MNDEKNYKIKAHLNVMIVKKEATKQRKTGSKVC